jgi:hypothetical protein
MAWWSVERWEALRLALGARGHLAARGGYVNPASKGASQASWRLPSLHTLARFAGILQTSDAWRRENIEAWLFESVDQKFSARCRNKLRVIRGLDPRIHPSTNDSCEEDGLPVKPGNDESRVPDAAVHRRAGTVLRAEHGF